NGASISPYLVERSFPPEAPWYRDRLGPATLALMAIALGGSVPNAFLFADLAFPFCIAFVLLTLCHKFFGFPVSLSVAAAASVMWLNWSDIIRLREVLLDELPNGATFLRTPYPQLSFLAFAIFIAAILNFHQRTSRSSLIFVGVSLLLNLYTYVYAWTLAII